MCYENIVYDVLKAIKFVIIYVNENGFTNGSTQLYLNFLYTSKNLHLKYLMRKFYDLRKCLNYGYLFNWVKVLLWFLGISVCAK